MVKSGTKADMSGTARIQLLAAALPRPCDIADLLPDASSALPDKKKLQERLAASPLLDWDAYLDLYPDVAAAGIEPCTHFMSYGIYEGRKLCVRNSVQHLAETEDAVPVVTVIITNYNNEPWLNACLASVLAQTLANIEIIVVDDASTDNSLAVIGKIAAGDPRVKVLRHRENRGTFMARKNAVKEAVGKYLMFLDSDDALELEACEKAVTAITGGHDIAAFNAKIVNAGGITSADIENCSRYFNSAKAGVYINNEILRESFVTKTLPWNLCVKLISTKICKTALAELPDQRLTMAEDMYAYFAICRHAKSLIKIDDPLYIYNYGIGVSGAGTKWNNLANWFSCGEAMQCLANYARKHGLESYIKDAVLDHCMAALHKWVSMIPADHAAYFFELICSQYGIHTILEQLACNYVTNYGRTAAKYRHCHWPASARTGKCLGIFYTATTEREQEEVLLTARELARHGYKVVLLEEGSGHGVSSRDGFSCCQVASVRDGNVVSP